MTLLVNQLNGFNAGGDDPLALTWLGSLASSNNSSSQSFNISPARGGLILLSFAARMFSNVNISTIAVNSVSGTIHDQIRVSNYNAGIMSCLLAAGGTVSVRLTLTGTPGSSPSIGIGAWLLTGYQSATPHFADTLAATGGTPTMTYASLAGGVAIFGGVRNNTTNATWSSATERADQTIGSRSTAFADKLLTVTGSGETETMSSAVADHSLGVGVWR